MAMPTTFNTIMPNMKYPNGGNVDYEGSNNLKISTVHTAKYKILQPKYLSKLYIVKDVPFYLKYKKPNIWWRFWQYILLGWKWENI